MQKVLILFQELLMIVQLVNNNYTKINQVNEITMEINYIGWNEYQAKSIWHKGQTFYGSAFRISRNLIIGVLVFVCVITPFTNFIIPLLSKIIKTGVTIRWS